VASAEQEWRRAVTFEGLEVNRNRSLPPLVMAPTLEEFIARNQKAEAGVREFLERRDVLTLPTWLQHFTLRPQPPYLAALGDFIEMDDFTSPSRLDQNGIRYVAPALANRRIFLGCRRNGSADTDKSMRARLAIMGSFARRGRIRTRYAGTTMTRVRMKVSDSTRKK
jgi:hypothetical protein